MPEIRSSLHSRLAAQNKVIAKLQADIERISRGCGLGGCLWKER